METFFKKYFWVFTGTVLVVLGILMGVSTSNFIASTLTLPPPRITVRKPAAPPVVHRNKGEAILSRNIFNSAALLPTDGTRSAEEEGEGDDGEVPLANLNVNLRVTMVSDNPDWSLAVLHDGSQTFLVRIGSTINPDAVVQAIEREKVYVLRGERLEMITFKEENAPHRPGIPPLGGPGASTSTGPSPVVASTSTPGDALAAGIKKVSETQYTIDRSMLEEQLQDLNKLGTMARIIPHYKDGKANGFKLVGIRPGSLYQQIGIRSGDVIRNINGEEIDSPNKALELYQKLRTASRITVDLERRGQRTTLEYQIK